MAENYFGNLLLSRNFKKHKNPEDTFLTFDEYSYFLELVLKGCFTIPLTKTFCVSFWSVISLLNLGVKHHSLFFRGHLYHPRLLKRIQKLDAGFQRTCITLICSFQSSNFFRYPPVQHAVFEKIKV